MKTSHQALTTILAEIRKPTCIVFGYRSAKGNYLTAVAEINFDYKTELNVQQLADGQELTEPGKRSWGEKLPNSHLIQHKDNYYLPCWITQTISHFNEDGIPQESITGYKDLKIERIKMLVIAERVFNIV